MKKLLFACTAVVLVLITTAFDNGTIYIGKNSTADSLLFIVRGYRYALPLTSSGMTNPMTTLGDNVYGGASGTPTRLPGNTTTGKYFYTQTGDGTNSAAPAWFNLYGTANTWTANQTLNAANLLFSTNNSSSIGSSSNAANTIYTQYLTSANTQMFFTIPNANSFRWSINTSECMQLNGTTKNLILGTITDAASSKLSVNSTTQGVLIPRMTKTQRNAIASPAAGLMVIVTGETGGEYLSWYNSSTSGWVKVTSSAD